MPRKYGFLRLNIVCCGLMIKQWRGDPRAVHPRTGAQPAKDSAISTQLLREGSGLKDSHITTWEQAVGGLSSERVTHYQRAEHTS